MGVITMISIVGEVKVIDWNCRIHNIYVTLLLIKYFKLQLLQCCATTIIWRIMPLYERKCENENACTAHDVARSITLTVWPYIIL